MGEPLISSVVCGAVALGMMWWNWQMMEGQRRRGRKVAVEAAEAGRARAKIRAEIEEAEAAAARVTTTTTLAAAPAKVPGRGFDKLPRTVSSPCLVKLWPLLESPENSPAEGGGPSPLFIKALRDRLETAPMSPAMSSPRPAGTGFFQEG